MCSVIHCKRRPYLITQSVRRILQISRWNHLRKPKARSSLQCILPVLRGILAVHADLPAGYEPRIFCNKYPSTETLLKKFHEVRQMEWVTSQRGQNGRAVGVDYSPPSSPIVYNNRSHSSSSDTPYCVVVNNATQ